jgi:hypothetical protein
MSKYIIKNCPAYKTFYPDTGAESFTACDTELPFKKCQDCTDCVMKQITELCKKVKLTYGQLDKPLTETQCTALFSRATLADEILQLLDIQEVE